MKVEGEKNISRLLRKIANICTLWNGTRLYNLQTCNHQHFVSDVLSAIGLHSNTKKLGSITKFVERIEQIGFSDMRLNFVSSFLQNEFPKSDYVTFSSHADIDNFFLNVEGKNPQYFHEDMEGKYDHFLLRIFDRSHHIRKEKGIYEKSDKPLNRGDSDLCPFNIEGLPLTELEHAEIAQIKKRGEHILSKSFLGAYETPNPAVERDWKY